MKISDITSANSASPLLRTASASLTTKAVTPQDTLKISEAAQQRIDQLKQGNETLVQALKESRLSIRKAASDRVGYAKEYLRILARMSLPGDRGAAAEAARMAKEIKGAAADFKSSISDAEVADMRSEIAGFAGVAGDALKIAKGLVESYLQKRRSEQKGDGDLRNEVDSAISAVREMLTDAMKPA